MDLGRLVDQGEGHRRFRDHLVADVGLALELARAAEPENFDVVLEDGAREDGRAELGLVDAHEEGDLVLESAFGEKHRARGLRHGLDDEDAGHHGLAGEVSLEELLIGGDHLDPYAVLSSWITSILSMSRKG